MADARKVCPAEMAGMLDNRFRRRIHPREKIVGPYVGKGDFVIDLGCGPGSFTDTLALLAGEGGHVWAVDIQEKMLKAMEEKVERLNLSGSVTAHLCRSESLMLQDYAGKADFVLAFWMVHEAPDATKLLEEVYTVLKPGGRFLCAEPKMHVSRKNFVRMVEQGRALGFHVEPVKDIRFSRSVLFTRGTGA